MKITVTNRLTREQELDVRALIAEIRSHDHFIREPYLSNMLNFDQDMPAFFLAYEGQVLSGFLTVYADEPDEVDLFLWVAPAYRRQGIARQLFTKYLKETANYGLGKPSFIVDCRFLEANAGLLEAWEVCETGEVELWMTRGREKFDLSFRQDLKVVLADMSHVDLVGAFQSQVFDSPLETAKTYAREAIQDDKSLLYVVLKEGEVVASCTVDISSGDQLLYGLAVKKAEQGQGVGSYMTKYILNDRIDQDDRNFQIAVEADNTIAKTLYEKLGFIIQSQMTYVK